MLEGYCAAHQAEPGRWQGEFYQLHPTPSGFQRHILRFSTNTRYDTAKEANEEMEAAIKRMNARAKTESD